ncbi:hypothetical protein DBV08_27210 [Rhodococcus sp. KBW08]|uniref:hypothetical protein n=1 Tax=Rhodococcus sp. KBW08 TaxID=2144188 RepID=UPI000F5B3A78|nr:hypothetical protein [Rhodococcus sp. KBW08]RQO43005.1 hypothetical protein DBV08_27210 [Rhodococcus sp. KBW08]
MKFLTTLAEATPNSPPALIIWAVAFLLTRWRGIIMLTMVPCTLLLALLGSADRSERAFRLLDVLLNRLGGGGEQ